MRLPIIQRRPADRVEADSERPKESAASLTRFILLLAVIAWAVRSFLVAPFSIPSGSMLPTLYIGDYLVVAKWPYGYSRYSLLFGFPTFEGRIFERLPKRGDVVVFRHPNQNLDLIKRVIGLPGDTIAVSDGAVVLNGKPLLRQKVQNVAIPISANSPCKVVPPSSPPIVTAKDGQACSYPAFREQLPGGRTYLVLDQVSGGEADDRAGIRVPPGHVFLMGDNRDDSLDSRFPAASGGVGMVPADHLIGRALVTFWSTDGSSSYFLPWTWFTSLRASRFGNGYSE